MTSCSAVESSPSTVRRRGCSGLITGKTPRDAGASRRTTRRCGVACGSSGWSSFPQSSGPRNNSRRSTPCFLGCLSSNKRACRCWSAWRTTSATSRTSRWILGSTGDRAVGVQQLDDRCRTESFELSFDREQVRLATARWRRLKLHATPLHKLLDHDSLNA